MITFQFVLKIFAIEILHVQDHHSKACFCLDHTWHERGTRLSSHNGSSRSIVKRSIFFTHFCDCTVKTEMIYRSTCAKNSFNRRRVGTIVYRQFSTTFADLWTMDSWLGKLGVRFLRVSPSSSQRFCPIHLVDCLH